MDWFSGKVSLGNFPDLAGAVNKLSEGVKIIEKNFDSALGFEEKSEPSSSTGSGVSGLWPSSDRKPLFDSFMGQEGDESTLQSTEKPESSPHTSSGGEKQDVETDRTEEIQATEEVAPAEEDNKASEIKQDQTDPGTEEGINTVMEVPGEPVSDSQPLPTESHGPTSEHTEALDSINSDTRPFENSEPVEAKLETNEQNVIDLSESADEQKNQPEEIGDKVSSPVQADKTAEEVSPVDIEAADDTQDAVESGPLDSKSSGTEEIERAGEVSKDHSDEVTHVVSELVSHENDLVLRQIEVKRQADNYESDAKEQLLNSGTNVSNSADSAVELEKLKSEMRMMETALQGAARQAQAKADEIARMMNENEQLKSVIEDLKRKSNEAETESLREEYHQRVSALERKVYALTKERDTLRREQSKKSDAAVLLKEKDEIINQVMAEGEELSKKQAAQESTIRKLRAQIREFEEEKKGLASKLQVEENKVESIKKDKAATEKLLQETIEKDQAELASQKEYYTNALATARETVALAEAQANSEARIELETRLREAEEREAMLVQTLEELRQTLSRQEQQAGFREDMLRRDIDDLQKRYQASERRAEELGSQFPDSTRPLLRQLEAMQESNASNQEAWAAVEANLTSRLREAEARAAAAEMKAASESERSSQYLSRVNVLEVQNSCLRAENSQLNRTIEKERQRAHENRQDYLAAKEEADTQEGRVKQLEEEIRELKKKHKQELHEALTHRERLEQEIEREKAARLDLERTASLPPPNVPDQTPLSRRNSAFDNGNLTRKLSNASSISSIEESILQASLDSSDNLSERRNLGETSMNQYYLRSMTPSAFEATLRQKEGELASYMSRLASVESIRNALAEELVEMTAQCEKLRVEANTLPALRAELEALRRRHSAALELMGERDEELEELRADIVDLKEMYREQVDLLVNKIQTMSSSSSTK